ncbi:MAG: multidrug export protein EmrA [Rhodospirillales bacterium 20-64-7]|nr:MAG: multidrug export protein EmrA [Rhodospirillales bacterium 20-64-7]
MSDEDKATPEGDEDQDAARRPHAKRDGAAADHDRQDDQDDDAGQEDEPPQKKRSKLPFVIAGGVVLLLAILYGIYYLLTLGQVSTDDAYTDGRAVSIASNVSGYVTKLDINDNSYVQAGQVLLEVDPREDQAAVRQAEANLDFARAALASAQVNLVETKTRAPAELKQAEAKLEQAKAQARVAELNYRREHSVDRRATSQTSIDQALERLKSAQATVSGAEAQVASARLVPQMLSTAKAEVSQREAQLAQAQANLVRAKVKLTYNIIHAPQAGWITMRNVYLGSFVQSGQQMFDIVSPKTWVTANFKENQLTHMRAGERVTLSVDAYPGLHLKGHVDSIQRGSGARFSAFPAENATGNFVKIVRRVPVKIDIDSGLPATGLPLGISVEATVYTQ